MPFADLGLHALALFVYPGLVAVVLLGALAESIVLLVLAPGQRRVALGRLRGAMPARPVSSAALGAALLAALAATQIAAPLNPVPEPERSLLVAAGALSAAGWLSWVAAGGDLTAGRFLLLVQGAWLVAVLAPAIMSGTLRPQAVGAAQVLTELPLKVTGAIVYLLALPGLLGLATGSPVNLLPGPFGEARRNLQLLRIALWLPYCGLFASLFLPPVANDIGGVATFLGASLLALVLAVALAGAAARWPDLARRFYPRVLVVLGGLLLLGSSVASFFV
ncbi:MAG: hypothetical protein J2P40_08065 [Candidatus Dormibacteraeota bacterium]|nr:hypothetical protein [Candidatus Dormibacteraeota bacterium]MBO0761215.1 hypothetical protein [Candidatus Dormibacteraeota bacterium]